jgi:probable biosynthetic protein (TIGR04099 family)
MNAVPLSVADADSPARWVRAYTAGMPQLAYSGLSENWLLKECGDLHWQALAAAHGQAHPAFHDQSGASAYAAFTALRVSGGELDLLAENEGYAIHSSLAAAGRAQYFSRHQLRDAGGRLARIDMLSAFVFRSEHRDNRSVGRAVLAEEALVHTDPCLAAEAEALAAWARARRQALRLASAPRLGAGMMLPARTPIAKAAEAPPDFLFSPCPNNDFNGANFLYFATFLALADRAEWQWFRPRPLLTVVSRDVVFHGNVNVGDDVRLRCLEVRHGAQGSLRHRIAILRQADGATIAEIETHKRPARAPAHC